MLWTRHLDWGEGLFSALWRSRGRVCSFFSLILCCMDVSEKPHHGCPLLAGSGIKVLALKEEPARTAQGFLSFQLSLWPKSLRLTTWVQDSEAGEWTEAMGTRWEQCVSCKGLPSPQAGLFLIYLSKEIRVFSLRKVKISIEINIFWYVGLISFIYNWINRSRFFFLKYIKV